LKERLKSKAMINIQMVASASFPELSSHGFSEDDITSIKDALDIFFRGGAVRPSY
jgi:hypothetical protein